MHQMLSKVNYRAVEKEVLLVLDRRVIPKTIRVSSDLRHVAYVSKRNVGILKSKVSVVVDGVEGKMYDSIVEGSMSFGGNSGTVAYVATDGTDEVLVVDNSEIARARQVGNPVFSPDGNTIAYSVQDDHKWSLAMEGPLVRNQAQREYDSGDNRIIFSPDSQHIAYVAQKSDKSVVVLDGEELGPYHNICEDTLVFAPNSQRLAYCALDAPHRDAKRSWVVDGRETAQYERAGFLAFSPDSNHYAHMGYKRGYFQFGDRGAYFVVIDGDEGFHYRERSKITKSQYHQWVNRGEPAFHALPLKKRPPVFRPDSRRPAYVVFSRKGYSVLRDGFKHRDDGYFMVVNDVEGYVHHAIGEIEFAPQSTYGCYAYAAYGKWYLQGFGFGDLRSGASTSFERVSESIHTIRFTPDGQRILIVSKVPAGWKRVAVIHGAVRKPEQGGGDEFQESLGDPFDEIFPVGSEYFRFNTPGQFSYIGYSKRGRELYRVDETIASDKSSHKVVVHESFDFLRPSEQVETAKSNICEKDQTNDLDDFPSESLLECPACSMFLTGKVARCPYCGASVKE